MVQGKLVIMKSICFVVTSMGGGGAERNVSLLANNLSKKGYDVHIFLLLNNTISYSLDSVIHVYFSKPDHRIKLLNIASWKKHLKEYCTKNNINTVVGVGINYGTICAYALKNNKKVKLIVRGTSTYKLSTFEKISVFLFGRRIDTFVCQTDAQLRSIPNILAKKSIVISNPFEIYEVNSNKDGYLSHKFICVGRLKLDTKKQDNIIKAFRDFVSNNDYGDYSLHFYGDDCDSGNTLSLLQENVHTAKIKNVYFHRFCKDIKDQILNSTAFICCSVVEGMPNALIESLMLGIPAISSDWSGSDEIISNGKNGYIFGNCDDIPNLTKCMEKIACLTEKEYCALSNGAFSLNKDKYSLTKIVSKWESIISKEDQHVLS